MNGRLIQPISLCFVMHLNQVLLLKRSPEKKVYPSKWDGIGGKVESGETPLDACIREVKEEANIQVRSPTLRGIFTLRDQHHQTEWIMFAFRVTEFSGVPPEKSKDGEIKWIPISDVGSLDTVPDLKLYISALLSQDENVIFGHFDYDEKGNLRNYILSQNCIVA